jgi:hypothetical protein
VTHKRKKTIKQRLTQILELAGENFETGVTMVKDIKKNIPTNECTNRKREPMEILELKIIVIQTKIHWMSFTETSEITEDSKTLT